MPGRRRQNSLGSKGADATGVGVGTFIVGVSRFFDGHATLQAFLVFIAPFAAVAVNSYVRVAFEKFRRARALATLLRRIENELADKRTTATRKQKLEAAREKVLDAQLDELLEQNQIP